MITITFITQHTLSYCHVPMYVCMYIHKYIHRHICGLSYTSIYENKKA